MQSLNISKLRIIVVSGRDRWQQSLKQHFPDFIYIAVDDHRFNTRLLDKADLVVFNYKYAGHGLYFRLINAVRSKRKQIVYVQHNDTKLFLDQVAQALGQSDVCCA